MALSNTRPRYTFFSFFFLKSETSQSNECSVSLEQTKTTENKGEKLSSFQIANGEQGQRETDTETEKERQRDHAN